MRTCYALTGLSYGVRSGAQQEGEHMETVSVWLRDSIVS